MSPADDRCRSSCPRRSFGSVPAADARAACRRRRPPGAAVLLRVGSRGSRLALTQAERAAEALRRPGRRDRARPDHHRGRSRPDATLRRDRSRGVFVKELEEALLEGRIDVAVHSAKDMTSTDATGSPSARIPRARTPRRALRRRRLRPGMRIGTASARRRAQLLAFEPTLSVEPLAGTSTRGSASAASAVSTPSCSPPAGSTGWASPPRSARRFDPDVNAARGRARARSRCRCARARSTSSRPPTTRRRAVAWRRSGAASPRRRRLPRPGRRTPRRWRADGLIAAEDGSWLERRRGTTRERWPRARRARAMSARRLRGFRVAPAGRSACAEERAARLMRLGWSGLPAITLPAHSRHGHVTRSPLPSVSPWAGGG